MSPRGRRPAGEDTRGAILAAAATEFGESGYDATSVRGVARRAGVDPALVHHYFDGKAGLFAAVMSVPVNPAVVIDGVLAGPRDGVGEALVRAFLGVWDAADRSVVFEGILRSAVSHEAAARVLREFITREIFGRIAHRLAEDDGGAGGGDVDLRAGLAAAQMVGLAMLRYVVAYPPVVEATHDELAALLGPTLQAYLAP